MNISSSFSHEETGLTIQSVYTITISIYNAMFAKLPSKYHYYDIGKQQQKNNKPA